MRKPSGQGWEKLGAAYVYWERLAMTLGKTLSQATPSRAEKTGSPDAHVREVRGETQLKPAEQEERVFDF